MSEVRSDGYYYCLKLEKKRDDSVNSILRFFSEQSKVIGVSVSPNKKSKFIFSNFFPSGNWFSENYENNGNYTISRNTISFECGKIIYKGTISKDKLVLFSHSNINGYETTEEYKFISFDVLKDIRNIDDF